MPEAGIHLASGKVRELYALDDERVLLVASDRMSTFDVILPTEVPDKGRVLTGLSAFWFARTRELVPNHLLALRDEAAFQRAAARQVVDGAREPNGRRPDAHRRTAVVERCDARRQLVAEIR